MIRMGLTIDTHEFAARALSALRTCLWRVASTRVLELADAPAQFGTSEAKLKTPGYRRLHRQAAIRRSGAAICPFEVALRRHRRSGLIDRAKCAPHPSIIHLASGGSRQRTECRNTPLPKGPTRGSRCRSTPSGTPTPPSTQSLCTAPSRAAGNSERAADRGWEPKAVLTIVQCWSILHHG